MWGYICSLIIIFVSFKVQCSTCSIIYAIRRIRSEVKVKGGDIGSDDRKKTKGQKTIGYAKWVSERSVVCGIKEKCGKQERMRKMEAKNQPKGKTLTTTADGDDCLPAWFLRLSVPVPVYSAPLAHLINLSFSTGLHCRPSGNCHHPPHS